MNKGSALGLKYFCLNSKTQHNQIAMLSELDLLLDVTRRLEDADLETMLTGSMALNQYAQPRMTRDIDIVLALLLKDLDLHHSNYGTPTNSKIDSNPKSCSRELMKNPSKLRKTRSDLTCIEICSDAGGQAIRLERAGFEALAHVEHDRHAWHKLNASDFGVPQSQRVYSDSEFPRSNFCADGVKPFN